MSHALVHVEWAVSNGSKIAQWYADLFDFKFTDRPDFDYATISWQQEAGINGGGFMRPTNEVPEGTISPYFYTEDVDAHMARIVAAGGTAIGESHTAPGVGTWWRFKDPAGNFAAIIKTDPSGMPE